MTTQHSTTRTRRGRRPASPHRLAHALVLAEARRLAEGGLTPDGLIVSGSIAWTEECATPLAARLLDTLARHGVDTGDRVIRAAVGALAVEAARHVEPGHAAEGRPWRNGSTPVAACANALYEADVDLNRVPMERALQQLGDAIASRALTDHPATSAAAPAPSTAPVDVNAADLLGRDVDAERTKSTIMNSTALALAASTVAALLYGAGLLGGRGAPVLAASIGAVVLALAAVAALIAAVSPRTGSTGPASADELADRAEHLAADPRARTRAAAAELARLQAVNAAKARGVHLAVALLGTASAAAAAAVLIETL